MAFLGTTPCVQATAGAHTTAVANQDATARWGTVTAMRHSGDAGAPAGVYGSTP